MYPYQTNDELGSNPDITQLLLRVLHEYETVIASQGSISSTSQEIFQWMDILEAQRLLDHLQLVLDRAEMIDEGSNHTIFLKMLRFLSRKFDILPTSLTLPDVSRHGNNSVAGGGFADIWHGSIGMVESLVCIKVLRLNIEQDENQRALIRKEFLHEALIWRQLKHPNVLPLLGVSSELFFPSFCLISPWMANSNVVSYLRRNPQHSFSQTFLDIAAGLDYLHTRSPPIIHGDIRGANILVNASGHCCLADFGLSVITTTSEAWSSATTSAMKGAIRWMAPEYVRQDGSTDTLSNHTPRDVYAFGCTIIEILTGKMPFYDRKTDVAVLLSLISGERPARPRDIWYPETVWEIATSCWAEDGQSRLNAATIYDRFKLMRTDPINSFMNFQHSPRKFDAFKWNHILNMTAEQELLRWFDLGMVERIKKHIGSISDIHSFLPSSAYEFAEGSHYGPVLDSFIVGVLDINPKLNPLLKPRPQSFIFDEGHAHLTWNLLLSSYMVHSSTDSEDATWSEGRDSPATFPRVAFMRVISPNLPFIFDISASDPDIGVTCGDLVDGIAESMREQCGKAIYESLSDSRQRLIAESYRRNRSQVPGVPGSTLGDGLRRLDFLGEKSMWGGIREDSKLVKEICGQLLSCTWLLECIQ